MMRSLAWLLWLAPLAASAQAQVPPVNSPQVNADRSITFRLLAPGASKVSVLLDISLKPFAMMRGPDGVWSTTTAPLPPEIYLYSYIVDGVSQLDPLNLDVVPNYVSLADQVLVPGSPPAPWELTGIPHGRVDRHRFTTHVAQHLPGGQDSYLVYTPPGYDEHRKGGYPVLYLLHGWSDRETEWTEVGRANLILDALIASGKAVPMLVVMPLGYGDLDFVRHGFSVWRNAPRIAANTALFSSMLLTEVLPAVEREYNVAPGRENRAIAGLSMGGLESLSVGLNHPAQFAYVAGMSSALFQEHFEQLLPNAAAKTASLRLLWVGCGTDDHLLAPNRHFIAWAGSKGFTPVVHETPGGHVWLVWRENLEALAPLLFQPQ